MKKRLLALLLFGASVAYGQSPVTIGGTITDAGGNLATSGTVKFQLSPVSSNIAYYVPGVTAVVPQSVTCNIQSNGTLQNVSNAGPCTVWGNDIVAPANTTYTVTFYPNGHQTGSVPQEYVATPGPYNLSAPVFAPIVSIIPQYSIITAPVIQGNLVPAVNNGFTVGNAQGFYANGFFSHLTFPFSWNGCLFVTNGQLSTTPSCSGGGGGGGVGNGVPGQFAYYNSTSSVLGDTFITDNAPLFTGARNLVYTGNGYNFSTTSGGSYSVTTSLTGAASTPQGLFTFTTFATGGVPATSMSYVFTAQDNAPDTNVANFNVSTVANGPSSGNVNFSLFAQGSPIGSSNNNSFSVQTSVPALLGTTQNAGNINLFANSVGAGIGPFNNSVLINAIGVNVSTAPTGIIKLWAEAGSAGSSSGQIIFQADNGVVFIGQANGCAQFSAGVLSSTGTNCGSGSGGGVSGSGSGGFYGLWTGAGTVSVLGNGHFDDGITTAGVNTSSEPLAINDGSGFGGTWAATEAAAPTPFFAATTDTAWADLTSHRFKFDANNAGQEWFVGIASAGTAGHCPQFAAGGIDLVDSGAPCAGGIVPGTPSHTADAGAGTGGSLVVSVLAGSNDFGGAVNLTTGGAPSAGSPTVGVITINYSVTQAAARHCVISASSPLAVALGNNALFIPQSTSTTTGFVITNGSTALPANTTGYQWTWSCPY